MLNYLLPILLFFTFNVFGQNQFTKIQLEEFKEKYKDYDFIYLKKDLEIIPFKSKSSDFCLRLNYDEKILILSPNGCEHFLKQPIEYSKGIQLTGAKSKSRSTYGKSQKAILSYEIQNISSSYVFYDGEKSKELKFENISVGDVIETSYSLVYEDGMIPVRYFFAEFAPVISSKVKLMNVEWVEFEKQLYNDNGLIQENKEQIGKNVYSVFSFTGNPYKHIFEFDSPSFVSLAPHIIFQVKECRINNKQIGLPDLASLQNLYRNYLNNVISDTSFRDLRVTTSEITKGLANDLEKMKAIYYWIQDNIHYLAFEEGLSGFRPRLAINTMNKKYGDCKDMAALLYGMAKSIGIEAQISWIGTRELPYNYEQTHNQYVDNHMIVTFIYQNKYYFLDATSDFQPFDLPTSFIQGKEALIFDDKSTSFSIEKVPIVSSFKNCISDSVVIVIEDSFEIGSKKRFIQGYDKISYHHLFSETDNLDKNIKKHANYFFRKENSSREIIFNKVKVNDRDSISEIELAFREKVSKIDNNRILLDVFTSRFPLDFMMLKNRQLPLELDYKYKFTSLTKVVIPIDYSISKIPENKSVTMDGINYQINYEFLNGALNQSVTIELDKLSYSKEEVGVLYKTISELSTQLNKPLILIKK